MTNIKFLVLVEEGLRSADHHQRWYSDVWRDQPTNHLSSNRNGSDKSDILEGKWGRFLSSQFLIFSIIKYTWICQINDSTQWAFC